LPNEDAERDFLHLTRISRTVLAAAESRGTPMVKSDGLALSGKFLDGARG
jgi:hypothetical protein